LPTPIVKSHVDERVGIFLGLAELPKIWGSPLILPQLFKLATSNLVYSLGLPMPIIKSHPKEKRGSDLGLRQLRKILGFSYNISATAGASDFKFGRQLGFVPSPVIKSHAEVRVGVALS